MLQHPGSRYRAFGLSLQSDLPLPELREDLAPADHPDVLISYGPAVRPTEAVNDLANNVCAGPRLFWMNVPGAARLLVRDGREIVVDVHPDAHTGEVRAYLLGSAMGALLHQRGLLPLHASAVEIDGRAVAFIAPSGGGKSTMAMHLQHLGQRVICDDICAVEVSDQGARLWPGLRNLKLWRASLQAIDRVADGLEPVIADIDKYRVPLTAPADDRAFALGAVAMLQWGERLSLEELSGAKAVAALIANTFRGQLVPPMQRETLHWQQCLAVFRASGVHLLTRPRALEQLDAASSLVMNGCAST